MAIISGETYLIDKLQSTMNFFLSSRYIIREDILSELPEDIVVPFLNTYGLYTGCNGVEIPITSTFPQDKQQGAFILVQFKGSVEDKDNSSIGNMQANLSDYDEGNEIKETLAVNHEIIDNKNVYYIETSYPIYSISNIPQISGSQDLKFSNNQIYLPPLPFIDDSFKVTVYYSKLRTTDTGESMDNKNVVRYGINLLEAYTIDFCSTNQDTIKCLTCLLQATLIYLRKTLEENNDLSLPEINMEGSDLIEEVNNSTDSSYGQQLYYRRATVTYHVTQSIMSDAGDKLKDIEINGGI